MTALTATAAVVEARGQEFRLKQVTLAPLASDEVLVRVVASGICATDSHGRDAYYRNPFPSVFGHEGAGIVERVGEKVTNVKQGDKVVMFAPSCGQCLHCSSRRPGACEQAWILKMKGTRRDGSVPFTLADDLGGKIPVYGSFFQQSSFSTLAVATSRNVVRIDEPDVPFEILAALPCGANTGAGAVVHVFKPKPENTLAIFGCGTVGLTALMAARRLGCSKIIAVDTNLTRLKLALELGATDTLESTPDVASKIRELCPPGVDFALEAVGIPSALRNAVYGLRQGSGIACLVGSARPGTEVTIDMNVLQSGRTVRGCIQGDSVPAEFIPEMVRWWKAGEFPVEKLVTNYKFEEVDQAVRDGLAGKCVKAVLKIGEYGK